MLSLLYYWPKLNHMVISICREAGKCLYSGQLCSQLKVFLPWMKGRIDNGGGDISPCQSFFDTPTDGYCGQYPFLLPSSLSWEATLPRLFAAGIPNVIEALPIKGTGTRLEPGIK